MVPKCLLKIKLKTVVVINEKLSEEEVNYLFMNDCDNF